MGIGTAVGMFLPFLQFPCGNRPLERECGERNQAIPDGKAVHNGAKK